MKKILSLVLALIMAFGLCLGMVGCNGDLTGGEEPGGEQPGGEQPGGEQPGGEQPGGEQPGGEQPGGEQPGGEQPGGEEPGDQGSEMDAFFAAMKEIDVTGFTMSGKATQTEYVADKFTYEQAVRVMETVSTVDTLAIDVFRGTIWKTKGDSVSIDYNANQGDSSASDSEKSSMAYELQDNQDDQNTEVSQNYSISFMRGTDDGMVEYYDHIYGDDFDSTDEKEYTLADFIPLYQSGERTLDYYFQSNDETSIPEETDIYMDYLGNPTVVQILLNIPDLFDDGVLAETDDGYTITYDVVKVAGKLFGMASTVMGGVELTTTVNDLLEDETLVELVSTLFNGVKAADAVTLAEKIIKMAQGGSSEMYADSDGAEGTEGEGAEEKKFLPDALADESVLDYLKRLASSTDFYQQISDMVGEFPFEDVKTFGEITVAQVLPVMMGVPAPDPEDEDAKSLEDYLNDFRSYLIQMQLNPAEYVISWMTEAVPEGVSGARAEFVLHFDKNKAFTKLTGDTEWRMNGMTYDHTPGYGIFSASGEITFQANVQDLTGMKYLKGYDYTKVNDYEGSASSTRAYYEDPTSPLQHGEPLFYYLASYDYSFKFAPDHKSVTVSMTMGDDKKEQTFDLSKEHFDYWSEPQKPDIEEPKQPQKPDSEDPEVLAQYEKEMQEYEEQLAYYNEQMQNYEWSMERLEEYKTGLKNEFKWRIQDDAGLTDEEVEALDPMIAEYTFSARFTFTIQHDGKEYTIENMVEDIRFIYFYEEGKVEYIYLLYLNNSTDFWTPIYGTIGENA